MTEVTSLGNETKVLVVNLDEFGVNGHQEVDNRPQWMKEYGQTLAELNADPLPEPDWIVQDLLTEGMNIVAGYFKSGKSYFILSIGVAIASGKPVLGTTEAKQGRVLYITLDDKRKARIRARIRKLRNGDTSPIPFDVYTKWAPLDGNGSDRNGTDDLEEYLNFYHDTRLVIFDVLVNVLPETRDGEKAYADIYKKLQRAKDIAADHNVALVFVIHTKKVDTDNKENINPNNAIYGSQAYGAIADQIRPG